MSDVLKITKREFDLFWSEVLSEDWYIEEGCDYMGDEPPEQNLFVEDWAGIGWQGSEDETLSPLQEQIERRDLSPYDLHALIQEWRSGRKDAFLSIRVDTSKTSIENLKKILSQVEGLEIL
jgi:hypothetical protein